MGKSILDYFPLEQIRQKQEQSLLFIEDRVKKGYRDIILQAPTGIGKSGILSTVCNWVAVECPELEGVKGGYYLTGQKLLQDQLEGDIPRYKQGLGYMRSIKSSVEYPCATHKNCGFGARAKPRCGCDVCPYRRAKAAFISSTIAVTNYSYFFAERRYAGMLEKRQVLACDECHNTERQIITFVDIKLSEEMLEKFCPTITSLPKLTDIHEMIDFVKTEYLQECDARLSILITLASDTDSDDLAKDAFNLDQHICKVRRAIEDIERDPSEWVFWMEVNNEKTEYIARPLRAAPFKAEMVDAGASLRIYASAYPGEKKIFCRSLGLDPDTTPLCRLASDFPLKNRPIIVFGVGSMSKRNQQQTLPSMLLAVEKIVEKHKEDRGLIHGHSYDICNKIHDRLAAGPHAHRLIFPKKADEREAAMELHASMPGAILITPSMTEGFDFKDDLARWQILPKIPYPSLTNKQVAAKAEQDPEWYSCETVKSIIQACGRAVRSATDHAVTYILDDDFWFLMRKADYMLPKWFAEAVTDATKRHSLTIPDR
jgi:ATP-dependent DNA helicase DinG